MKIGEQKICISTEDGVSVEKDWKSRIPWLLPRLLGAMGFLTLGVSIGSTLDNEAPLWGTALSLFLILFAAIFDLFLHPNQHFLLHTPEGDEDE